MSAIETPTPAATTSTASTVTIVPVAPAAPAAEPASPPAADPTSPPGGDADESKKLASENRTLRQRLRDLEAAEAKRAESDMSELERAQKRAAEAEERATVAEKAARDHRLRADIAAAATRLGIAAPPDDIARLLDVSDDELGDDGYPKDIDAVLGRLVEQRPYLKGVGAPLPTGGAAANPASGGPASRGTFTKSQIADRAFYEAHRAEIEVAMREGRIVSG